MQRRTEYYQAKFRWKKNSCLSFWIKLWIK